jgi:tetratricopeptide (TPR) repeat protein
MGGVGKTELATQYARIHEADYPGGICWLNARDTNLAAEIIQFAQLYLNLEVPQELGGRRLNLEEQVAWCWQHWYTPPAPLTKGGVREGEGLVLMVLDDVTDLASCRKVLPTANRFRVLMTTRLRRIDTNFVEISLDVLPADKALELLASVLGERDRRVQREPQTAEELCKWLGYLPLGLELVGRYLAQDPDLSLAEMLERLKATPGLQDEAIDPDEEQLQDTEMTAKRGVRAAFELSWQELEPVTQRVAQFLSLFAPTVFLWEWVASATELFNCSKSEINAAKKQLHKRHLIERIEERDGGYKIHPLIRGFLQVKLAASEQADEFRRAFAAAFVDLAKVIPDSPTRKFVELVKNAIPHLEEVAQNLTDALRNEYLLLPFVGLARFYKGQGLYAVAEPWYWQCLELKKHLMGEDHPAVATSLNNLAELYRVQGRYSEAEALYAQAISLYKRFLGADNLYVATSLNNLAALYHSQWRYTEAEPLYVKTLALFKHLLGADHPYVATSLNNLAEIYRTQERYTEAEALLLEALALRKSLLGADHPHVAISLNNLAQLYRVQERYAEAQSLFLQALELNKSLLGDDHPDIAISLNNLAELYHVQEHYAEAELLYVQALALRKRLLGADHPYVAISLHNLAALYRTQGRYREAESLLLQALALYKRLQGAYYPHAATLNNLAALYRTQGRYREAESLLLQALTVSERVLGVNHPDTITFCQNLELLQQERSTQNS